MNNDFYFTDEIKILINKIRKSETTIPFKKGDIVSLFKKKIKNNYPKIGEIGKKFIVLTIDEYSNVWVKRLNDNQTFKHPVHKDYFCSTYEYRNSKLEILFENL